jgi:hypothetical protein
MCTKLDIYLVIVEFASKLCSSVEHIYCHYSLYSREGLLDLLYHVMLFYVNQSLPSRKRQFILLYLIDIRVSVIKKRHMSGRQNFMYP